MPSAPPLLKVFPLETYLSIASLTCKIRPCFKTPFFVNKLCLLFLDLDKKVFSFLFQNQLNTMDDAQAIRRKLRFEKKYFKMPPVTIIYLFMEFC